MWTTSPATFAQRSSFCFEVTSAPGYAPNLSIVRNAISVRRLPSRVALPGIGGLLAIDPSVMVFIPSTIVNQGIGQATISVAIPNNAQLRGVSFEVQSLFTQVGLGEGFSNAWTETVR